MAAKSLGKERVMPEIKMVKDKVCKHSIRYAEPDGTHNIYVANEVVAELGKPDKIKVTLEPDKG
jgi:hypothetical protein